MTETVPRPAPARTPPPPPLLPGPLEAAVLAWRTLRRMSTALILLFALAVASIIATVIPQSPVAAGTVQQWLAGEAGPGESVASVLQTLGLFDVFGSTWFATLTVLLFVSLTGCLIPRWRGFVRLLRRPPVAGKNLERLSSHQVLSTSVAPDQALAIGEQVLRRRRFRRRRFAADDDRPAQLAGERGNWREGGSLVFHTAFYLLLGGVAIAQLFGFTGQVGLVEGGAFADTRIAYDYAEPGRQFGVEDHRGFVVKLDDFEATFREDLTPSDFVSRVTVSEGGRPVRTEEIRVNQPLRHAGMTLYQLDWGIAPRIVVRAGDVVLFDEAVLLTRSSGPAAENLWTGTAKLRVDNPTEQLALDIVLVPDAQLRDGEPVVGPNPKPENPVMVTSLYFGDLGLERPVPARRFDRSGGAVADVMLRPGDTKDLVAEQLSVELADVRLWSGLQVSHQPGRPLLLAGAGLLLVGLIPSLYSYRRRVWVEARPSANGTDVHVAGVALHRKPVFDAEFAALVSALRTDLPAADAARSVKGDND